MLDYPPSVRRLIAALRELPTVGPRSAERLALHLLQGNIATAENLASALQNARSTIQPCKVTGFFSENGRSEMLDDPKRDHATVCVVEQASDVIVFEKSNAYRGLYFVLGGCLSPLDDIGPEELRIPRLLQWVGEGSIKEVIIGLSPDVKGETTSLYLAGELKKLGTRVTRPATGLSVGGALEYADSLTLSHALEDRKEI